jgi:hypothetical protein
MLRLLLLQSFSDAKKYFSFITDLVLSLNVDRYFQKA